VTSVSATNIFARAAPGGAPPGGPAASGQQYLAYSMTLAAPEDLAMILPLPAPQGVREDAVRFIDLSGYPEFFDHLANGFPEEQTDGDELELSASLGSKAAPLAVVDVGSFQASFVPTIADFDRLDPRFRLPTDVWPRLGRYASFGFAVFRLKAGQHRIHPMALTFLRADPTKLFFPTVHVHDGEVHETADFDHALYCQRAVDVAPDPTWRRSSKPTWLFTRPGGDRGLLERNQHCLRRRIVGPAPNRDVYVEG
jgi:hypothetical protein